MLNRAWLLGVAHGRPLASRVLDETAENIHLRTRDPHEAITTIEGDPDEQPNVRMTLRPSRP